VAALSTADFGEYTITGDLAEFTYESKGETITVEAGTWKTTCAVKITGTNYIKNGSFEDGKGEGWTLTNTLGTGSPYLAKNAGDAKDGDYLWSAWAKGSMDFSISQTLSANEVPNGKYTLFAYYQGTNVETVDEGAELYAEVTYTNGTVDKYSAEIAIPNDPTNEGRALLLLESAGLIKLKEGAGITATPLDIAENPKNLSFKELEAASLPRALEDVDAAVINGNYAIPAGLVASVDGLFVEGADSPYVNIVAVKDGNQSDERIIALVKALQSEEIASFIAERYPNGEVVKVF